MEIFGKVNSPTARLLRTQCPELNVRLRWGGPQVAGGAVNGSCHLLNGLEQLQAFRRAGLACPVFTTSYAEACAWIEAGQIVLGRKACHSQGRDIIVWEPRRGLLRTHQQRFAQRDFWVQAVTNITNEWRFHIMRSHKGNYMSIGRGRKVQTNGYEAMRQQRGLMIRSRRCGWTLDHTTDPSEPCREAAKRAVQLVGYDMGAVDLLETTYGPVVLEVNSCPAIHEGYTLDKYRQHLAKYYGQGR